MGVDRQWNQIPQDGVFYIDNNLLEKGMFVTGETDRIRQARKGDAAAWEQIVQEHQQPVFRLAYLILGDADEAEDIAQEAFIRAYRALGRFDARRPMRPWLLRIAANLAYNRRRGVGRYFQALQRLLNSTPHQQPVAQRVDQRLESGALWRAVRRLGPADQRVIYLRYFLECSESESAEALGVPKGTVKSRLHRALKRLRAILEEELPEAGQEETDGR